MAKRGRPKGSVNSTTKERLERGVYFCRRCEQELPLEQFFSSPSRSTGYYSLCKDCNTLAAREGNWLRKIKTGGIEAFAKSIEDDEVIIQHKRSYLDRVLSDGATASEDEPPTDQE